MAAIIAQMTRANRERTKRKKGRKDIGTGKCVYEIGPFPEKYEPEVVFVLKKYIFFTYLDTMKITNFIMSLFKISLQFF